MDGDRSSAGECSPGQRGAVVFASICGLSFLVNFGRVAFAPLVDVFIETGIPPATAGFVATAVWLGSAVPRFPTGYLLTLIRRHHALLGTGIGLSGAATVVALSRDIQVVIGGALLVGLASGVFFVAANPLISELFPDNVGRMLGIRGVFSQIAAVVAPTVVVLTIALGSWRLSFVALAILALAMTGTLSIAARRADLPNAGQEDRALLAGIRSEWRLIVAGIALVGAVSLAWQGVFNFYVTYLRIGKGVAPGVASRLLTLTFAAGIPSWLIAGRLADRVSHRWLLIALLGGFSLSLWTLTLANSLLTIGAASVVTGFLIHGVYPVGDAYLLDTLPDRSRASAYSGYSGAVMLIQAPGSVIVGSLADAGIPYTDTFQWVAVILAGLTICLTFLAVQGWLPAGSD